MAGMEHAPSGRTRSVVLVAAICATVLVVASGCGGGGVPEDPPHRATRCAELFGLDASDPFVVGMHRRQPGLNREESEGTRHGFDYDLALHVAQYCGIDPGRVSPRSAPSDQRETLLAEGHVAMIVATYSITDERSEVVGFAGPYLVTHQDVMVRENSGIETLKDLSGATVCTVEGGTSWEGLLELPVKVTRIPARDYGACAQKVRRGAVDAMSTDQIILHGYRLEHGGLRLLGMPFGPQQRYGIGIRRDRPALCELLNDAIRDYWHGGRWNSSFSTHFDDVDPTTVRPGVNDLRFCPDEEDR